MKWNKFNKFVGIAFAQTLILWTSLDSAFAIPDNRQYLTSDFFIETVETKSSHQHFSTRRVIGKQENCRAKIQSIVCLVDPVEKDQDPKKRTCLAGGENYARFFETLYDFYPPALQRMFCSLDVIFIERDFFGTAYAGIDKDKTGKILGAQMGIRKSVLDEGLNLTTWASWKEQLSFGGITDSYTVSSHLPTVVTSAQGAKVNDFLYFVIAHEFGHIFDFTNEINKTKNCPEVPDDQEKPECAIEEGSWGGISWLTTKRPKPENDFLNRGFLCFYWCKGNPLDPNKVPRLYEDLFETDFISIYATTQPWDDFADSLAYYLVNKNLQATYVIHTNQGKNYDIMGKLSSPIWNKKFQFLEKFLNRPDIVYP